MVRRWLPSGRATGSHQRCALRKRTTREMWLYLVRTQNGSGVFSVGPYICLIIFGRKPSILKIISFIDIQILYTMPPLCRGVQSKTIRARRATSLSARTEVVPQICLSKCLIHPSSIPSTLRKLRRNRLFKSYKLRNRRCLSRHNFSEFWSRSLTPHARDEARSKPSQPTATCGKVNSTRDCAPELNVTSVSLVHLATELFVMLSAEIKRWVDVRSRFRIMVAQRRTFWLGSRSVRGG